MLVFELNALCEKHIFINICKHDIDTLFSKHSIASNPL